MFVIEQLIPRLAALYGAMDTAYAQTAFQGAFSCNGCDGVKCCTIDLMIHSFIEMSYMKLGFLHLPEDMRTVIMSRCADILAAKQEDPFGDAYRNSVCVLNFNGLCSLYAYRPMICRLAGIRHVIIRPDGTSITGSGCPRFEGEVARAQPHLTINRTGFYGEMAEMEMEVVRAIGERTIPRSIAEVLGEFA